MHHSSLGVLLLLSISTALVVSASSSDDDYRSDCFSADAEDTCKSKTITIKDKIYGCKTFINFESEVVKIEFREINNEQFVLVSDKENIAYTIDEENGQKEITNLQTAGCTYVKDNNGNAYAIDEGNATVISNTGISRNIETENQYIPVELIYDSDTNTLIILAVKQGRNNDIQEGTLFSIDTNYLTDDNLVKAVRVSPKNVVITGVGIYKGLGGYLLGIKSGGQFRYVVLSEVKKSHKCYTKTSIEADIINVFIESSSEAKENVLSHCRIVLAENPRISETPEESSGNQLVDY